MKLENPESNRFEEPYELIDRVPLVGNHHLQIRLDLDDGIAAHLNQDITNIPGRLSRDLLGEDHFKPLY